MAEKNKPDTQSGDRASMNDYYAKVTAMLGGVDAMRAAGPVYLPKFDKETDARHSERLAHAKMTNVFRDIVENLSQRPFSKPVKLSDDSTGDFDAFLKDVDACGNSLHVFAGETMFNGIAYSIDWILVDYTKGVPVNATQAEEKALGVRPYWVGYRAEDVLAAHSAIIDGQEQFVHVRLCEPRKVQEGFEEQTVERIRVLIRDKLDDGVYAPARWEVWEKVKDTAGKEDWAIVEEGPISIGIIPLVPFICGRRKGKSWQTHPPMKDAADLQVDLYQQETGLKYAKAMTAFPMLAGNGVAPQIGEDGEPVPVRVGPHTVLYGGEGGAWSFVEPAATSMAFLASDIKETITQLREIGRQPLTAQSGNLTVVTTAVAAEKGNAAIQAWAINLSDALAQALVYTAMWLKLSGAEPVVKIDTEFDLTWDDQDTYTHVLALRKDGEISREATIHEAKRRRILDTEYDPDADLEQLLEETESDDDETELETEELDDDRRRLDDDRREDRDD